MANFSIERKRARSQAIQLLFQADIQGVDVIDVIDRGDYALDDGPLAEYAAELARGVAVNQASIDRLISGLSHNWHLSRMPLVDRCVMAVAIYEIFYEDSVPASVAISEAVELSKVYGTEDSSSFVNGILGRVATLADTYPDTTLAMLSHMVEEVVDGSE